MFQKEIIDDLTKTHSTAASSQPSTSRTSRSRLLEDDHDPLRVPPRHPHGQPVSGW